MKRDTASDLEMQSSTNLGILRFFRKWLTKTEAIISTFVGFFVLLILLIAYIGSEGNAPITPFLIVASVVILVVILNWLFYYLKGWIIRKFESNIKKTKNHPRKISRTKAKRGIWIFLLSFFIIGFVILYFSIPILLAEETFSPRSPGALLTFIGALFVVLGIVRIISYFKNRYMLNDPKYYY